MIAVDVNAEGIQELPYLLDVVEVDRRRIADREAQTVSYEGILVRQLFQCLPASPADTHPVVGNDFQEVDIVALGLGAQGFGEFTPKSQALSCYPFHILVQP